MELILKMIRCLTFFLISLHFGECRLPKIQDACMVSFRNLIEDAGGRIRSLNKEGVHLGRHRTLDKRKIDLLTPLNMDKDHTNLSGESNINLSTIVYDEAFSQLSLITIRIQRHKSKSISSSARRNRFKANIREINSNEMFRDLPKQISNQTGFKTKEMRLNRNMNREQRNQFRGQERSQMDAVLREPGQRNQFKGQKRSRMDSILQERGQRNQFRGQERSRRYSVREHGQRNQFRSQEGSRMDAVLRERQRNRFREQERSRMDSFLRERGQRNQFRSQGGSQMDVTLHERKQRNQFRGLERSRMDSFLREHEQRNQFRGQEKSAMNGVLRERAQLNQFKRQESSRLDSVLRERGNTKRLVNRRREISVETLLKPVVSYYMVRTKSVFREHGSKQLVNRRITIPMRIDFKTDSSSITIRTFPRKSIGIARHASQRYFTENNKRRSVPDPQAGKMGFYLKNKSGVSEHGKSNPVLPSTEQDVMSDTVRSRQKKNMLVSRRELKIPSKDSGLIITRTDLRKTWTYGTQSRNVEKTLRKERKYRGSRRRYGTKENSGIHWKFVENADETFNQKQLFIKHEINPSLSENFRQYIVLSRKSLLGKSERGNNLHKSLLKGDSNLSVERIRHSRESRSNFDLRKSDERNIQNRYKLVHEISDKTYKSRSQNARSSRSNIRAEIGQSRTYENIRFRYNPLVHSRINLEKIHAQINLERIRSKINLEYIRSEVNLEHIRSRIKMNNIRSRLNLEQIKSRINPDKAQRVREQTRSSVNTERFNDNRMRQRVNVRSDRFSMEPKQTTGTVAARFVYTSEAGRRFTSSIDSKNENIRTSSLREFTVQMQRLGGKDKVIRNPRVLREQRRVDTEKLRKDGNEDRLIERRLYNIRNDQSEGDRRIKRNQRRISTSFNKRSDVLFESRMDRMKDVDNRRILSSRRKTLNLRVNMIGDISGIRSFKDNRRVVANQRRVAEPFSNIQLREKRRQYNLGQNLFRNHKLSIERTDTAGRNTVSELTRIISRNSFTSVKQTIDQVTSRTAAAFRGSRIRREVTKSAETQERRLAASKRLDKIQKSSFSIATDSTSQRESHKHITSSRDLRIMERKSILMSRSPKLTERFSREQRDSLVSHNSKYSAEAAWSLSEILISKRSTIISFVLNSLLGLAVIVATYDDTSKGFLSRRRAQFMDHMSRFTMPH